MGIIVIFKTMKGALVILALCLSYVNAGDVMGLIEDCGSMGGAITALDFEGCDGDYDDQCEVARGSSAKGKMTFAATGAAESLECKIYGIILGLEVPSPVVAQWLTHVRLCQLVIVPLKPEKNLF